MSISASVRPCVCSLVYQCIHVSMCPCVSASVYQCVRVSMYPCICSSVQSMLINMFTGFLTNMLINVKIVIIL